MTRFLKIFAPCLCAVLLCAAGLTAHAADEVIFDGAVDAGPWDSGAAFADYVERLFQLEMDPPGRRPLRAASADTELSKLSEQARAAYRIMVPLIRQVANGERDSAVFYIYDAGMPVSERGLLFHALMADLPYEMYWTSNSYASSSISGIAYEIYLDVGVNYRPAAYDDYTPTVDTAKTGAASQALVNAQNIAAQACTLDNNIAKLDFIKNTICDLVVYNDAAAFTPNYHLYDFDPWQLIYVFDGDPDTNVVCEGYAKAFQYLCDNAELAGGAACWYVDGVFTSDDGDAGGHAWNVVRLANGRSYLVDVTHCDQDSSQGSFVDDRRFLAGGTGSVTAGYDIHLPEMRVQIDGKNYRLSACDVNYTYSDNTLALWSDGILALSDTGFDPDDEGAHAWGDAVTIREEDCFQDGLLQYTCADCGATYEFVVTCTGHSLFYHTGHEPTCTEPGWSEYFTCTRCDYTTYMELPPRGHDLTSFPGQDPTCTEPGWAPYEVCSNCDYTTYTELPAQGHDLVTYLGMEPTCTEPGWSDYEACTRCGYTTYMELAPQGHAFVHDPGREPSCYEPGWEEYDVCSRCGYSTGYTELPPTGHEFIHTMGQEPTCTEPGWSDYEVCIHCGYATEQTELPPQGHDLVYTAGQEPTCTEPGWTGGEICTRCGYLSEGTELPARGHDLIHHPGQAPTQTSVGWQEYDTCTRCDYTTYVELPMLPSGGPRGDLTGDNKVNAKDVVFLQRALAGGYGMTVDAATADLTGDNKVNAKDVVLLQRFIAGGYNVTLK